ncbi:hypothetical protein H8356DRAFT_1370792 [Neocallimastix lanati (nom. inval.)]|uniref:Uncharacterized protein n=1 Tax=Neocallimastix californiae TaxID=1754190 RepID=A0A1Y2D7Q0_9FUNG|nr:hypothetical protein H8356DRAFT_1370792 [Neocallimastix sp. JGI-2020a]ORY55227.1 hypothetical protein LY90DRAFT_507237 [Neocallimastix californiae]|eukprot:ORY55227.1 hypothetical protein LY90DRAFT_507237 [Neocallimastix californiae]
MKEQLLNGIRYLDIRLSDVNRNINHEIYITHGDIAVVTIYCWKEGAGVDHLKFDDVKNDKIDFLIEHPSEAMIMHLKMERIERMEENKLFESIADRTVLNTNKFKKTNKTVSDFFL